MNHDQKGANAMWTTYRVKWEYVATTVGELANFLEGKPTAIAAPEAPAA